VAKDFYRLQLFNRINNLIRKIEKEEFKLINSELFAELGNSLGIAVISLFEFKNIKEPSQCNLIAYWNNESLKNITYNLDKDFILCDQKFMKKLNNLDCFTLKVSILKALIKDLLTN
jgi:hypothetical protein